jgi:hypothetical protein
MSESSSVQNSSSVSSDVEDTTNMSSSLVDKSSVEVSSGVEVSHLLPGDRSSSSPGSPGGVNTSGLLEKLSDSVLLDSVVPLEALRSSVDGSPSDTTSSSLLGAVTLVSSDGVRGTALSDESVVHGTVQLLGQNGTTGDGVGTDDLTTLVLNDGDNLGLSTDEDDPLVRVGFNLSIGHSLASGLLQSDLEISDQLAFSELQEVRELVELSDLGSLLGGVDSVGSNILGGSIGS